MADVSRCDAGDPTHALNHFAAALRTQPQRRDGLAAAGESAFELGDYARARRYLGAVAGDVRLADLLEVARLVVTGDPLAPRIGAAERRRRLSAAVAHATSRLDACLGAPPAGPRADLESLHAEALALTAALRRRRVVRDVIEDGLDLAYRIERAVKRRCAVPAVPFDRALQLLGRRYGFDDVTTMTSATGETQRLRRRERLLSVFPGVRGSGVPQPKAAFHLHGGSIPFPRAGREVRHGRAGHRIRPLPSDINAALLGSTVVASVASVVVRRSILGNEPLFHVPP